MKKSKMLILPILASALLVGCGKGGASDEVTLTIYEDASNKEVVQALGNEFLTEYRKNYPNSPKITIKVIEQAEKSAVEKLASGVAESGKGPDIAAVTHDTIASGVGNKIIAPVMFKDEMKNRMTEDALNAVTYQDELYGYPITAESTTIMYDSTQVTADELSSWENLKASGKKIALGVTGDDGGYYTWGLYTDSILFGEDGKHASEVNIATTEAVENVHRFYSEFKDYIMDATPEIALNHVTAKRAVGLVSSPFILDSMKNALGSNFKIAKLPTLGGKTLRPFSGYKAYVVSRYSKNAALAHAFCNYLTSYDSNFYRLVNKGYLPATHFDGMRDIVDYIDNNEESRIFAESLRDSRVMPNIPEMANFWKPMNNASTAFLGDTDLTVETVRSKLNEVTNKLLGK